MTEYVIVYAYSVDSDRRRIPMILKNKPDYLKGKLNLPGGKIEVGESPVEAAIRELKEETGLEDIGITDGMCPIDSEVMGLIRFDASIIYCVMVPITHRQELKQYPEETEPVGWYDFFELMQDSRLITNLRIIIPLMQAGVKGWDIIDYGDGTGERYALNHIHFYENGYDKRLFREHGKFQYPELGNSNECHRTA